jgi:anti-sigma-K factor RskA
MNPHQPIELASMCDAIQELIPDYAFGLTSAEETRLVESKLAACPDAADQLAEFRRLQDDLRADVPQITPPPHLEARLMAAIVQPITRPKPRRSFPIPPGWLVAAAAIIILMILNLNLLARVDDLTRRQNELVSQIAAVQQNTGQVASDHQNTSLVLTGTNGLRWVRLPASPYFKDASAFLMWNAESETGLLYAQGFPKLAFGKTYQLWLTRGEERISAGTFRVDKYGKGALLFHSDRPIDKFTWARITAEPVNGSEYPSDTVVVNGKIST